MSGGGAAVRVISKTRENERRAKAEAKRMRRAGKGVAPRPAA
jgi:hypothetical protein